MNILVLNCGSSSLKFQIIATDQKRIDSSTDECLAKGLIERIGSLALVSFQAGDQPPMKEDSPIRDFKSALVHVAHWLSSPKSGIKGIASVSDIDAVGHRVVHGGEKFQMSVKINPEVVSGIEECMDLAPLHNHANLRGISAAQELFGAKVPQAVVFDTAFHATMPESSYLYGIPYHFYRRYKIRRYGFHGTSHRYIAYNYRLERNIPREKVNIISLHLGNGCSACAIKAGMSFNTSMGFTPLEGLVMGTRAGDMDAAILPYLTHKEGLSLDEI
jgi:acetate kinase